MNFDTLIQEARTVRRFKQTPISDGTLDTLVSYIRYSPCGANQQKLKVMTVNDSTTKNMIFPLIKWAGALKDWDGPSKEERPMAYMILLLDKDISSSPGVDHGIAAQSILLGARAMGLGTCMIGAYNKPKLIADLEIPDRYEPLLILALGEPDEAVVIDDHVKGKALAYYRDEDDVHHVPKRTVDELKVIL